MAYENQWYYYFHKPLMSQPSRFIIMFFFRSIKKKIGLYIIKAGFVSENLVKILYMDNNNFPFPLYYYKSNTASVY